MRKFLLGIGTALSALISLLPARAAESQITLVLGQATVTSNEAFNLFVPQELGYFKEDDIKLEYQTSQGGTQGIQLLSASKADLALTSVPGVIIGRQQGVTAIAAYNYLRRHATAIAVASDGPIKTPTDLKGKVIGVVSMAATRTFDGRAMIRAAGLDPDKDVQWLPVGFGAQAATALMRGTVAALTLWDATYVDMLNQGIGLRFFTFPFQENLVGYVFATTDATLAQRRLELIRFFRAIAKGTVFASANPVAAACIYLKASGDLKQAKNKQKALQDATNVVKDNVKNAALGNPNQAWGSFPSGSWAENAKYYEELGVVKPPLPSLSSLYIGDDAFFKEVANFDSGKIVQQARDYKCDL